MQPTKRTLCIHDLSCVGRSSLSVVLPVLASMGVQPCALPTALLSTHTGGFGVPSIQNTEQFVIDAISHYAVQDIRFDCIYTGYLSTAAQAESILRVMDYNESTLTVVDPVMGDNAKPYSFVTDALQQQIAALCHHADIITPNKTESALLLGQTPHPVPIGRMEAACRLRALHEMYPNTAVVITGLDLKDGGHVNACMDKQGVEYFTEYAPLPGYYPGAGDLFTSVLTGSLLQGDALQRALHRATEFVAAALANTPAGGSREGIIFEPLLHLLTNKERKPIE